MRRNNWKDYFTFSKKERVAVIILLAVIVLLVLIPFLYPDKHNIIVDENLVVRCSIEIKIESQINCLCRAIIIPC